MHAERHARIFLTLFRAFDFSCRINDTAISLSRDYLGHLDNCSFVNVAQGQIAAVEIKSAVGYTRKMIATISTAT